MNQLSAEALLNGLGLWIERPGPRYLRLADAVQDVLARDSIPDGCRLPAERELAELLGLSRGTVVAAYAALSERGVVRRRQGSGTRVIAAAATVPEMPRHTYPQLGNFVMGPAPQIDMAFGAPYVDEHVWHLQGRVTEALRAGGPAHGYAPLGLPALREGI